MREDKREGHNKSTTLRGLAVCSRPRASHAHNQDDQLSASEWRPGDYLRLAAAGLSSRSFAGHVTVTTE